MRSHPGVEELPSQFPAPWEELMNEELRTKVTGALQTLTADERALLTLRFDEGLTIREIAEVFERPAATVHVQLERAIEHLRRTMGIPFVERVNP